MTDHTMNPPTDPWDAWAEPASLLGRLRDGSWLDAETFPPLAWAVEGLIPEGMGLFTGPPKAGKSWATLGLALAVAGGRPAFGKVPTGDPRPVLLLALEDGPRRLQGRARRLLGEGEIIPSRLEFTTQATPAEVPLLIGEWLAIHGHERPLVILDTLGKVMPPTLRGESDYQRDYRVGGALKALVDEHPGACLLAVHHTRKAASEDWMDSTSGTNGLNGAADWTLNLARSRNEGAGIIRVTGRDVPEGEYAVTYGDRGWTLDGNELAEAARRAQEARATAGVSDTTADVLRIVREHPEGIGPAAVAQALGMTTERAGQILTRLLKAGKIHRPGRGVYTFVPSGESGEVESSYGDQLSNSPNSPHCSDSPSGGGAR